MRGALIHGVLLAVMLVYGYRTWTRDKTVKPDRGSVVLWDKSEADVASVEYKTDKKTVRLEQRKDANGAYWWGVETTIEKRPKKPEKKPETPPVPQAAGSGSAGSAAGSAGSGSAAVAMAGSGSAGSGSAGSGSAGSAPPPPKPPEPVVMEEVKKTVEYPVGEGGMKVLDGYFKARALRDLGKPTDALLKDYKLDAATTTLTVAFRDGSNRTFVVGGSVFNTGGGASDRYVMDKAASKAFVLSKDMLGSLEVGQSSLNLVDPRGFDATLIGGVVIEAPGQKAKTVPRVTTGSEGGQVKTWGDAATKKPNQTLANFIDNANNLRPTEYASDIKVGDLTPVMKLTYKDDRGGTLGTLGLYKVEKPGEVPEGVELDPANPPRGEVEYYIVTEKTRVPGLVRKDTAQRTEQDVPVVFSDNPPAEVKKPDPNNNPFGNVPLPPREKTPPPDPHGGLKPPGGDPHGGMKPPGAPGGPTPAPGPGSAAAPKPPGPAGAPTPVAPKPAAPAPATGSGAAPKPAAPAGSAAAAPHAH